MFSALYIQILRLSAGRSLIILVLILLPLPVSIPLVLWLNRHERHGGIKKMVSKRSGSKLTFGSRILEVKRRISASLT